MKYQLKTKQDETNVLRTTFIILVILGYYFMRFLVVNIFKTYTCEM